MTVPTVACTNCGKNFTTDDLRGTSCRYCGTLLAHHARAAQQVAVVNQMMVDRNGNGIPDAFEGLVANAQANAYNQAFGIGPGPYGQPPVVGPPGIYPNPAAFHVANVHQQVTNTMSKVVLIVAVSVGLVTFLVIGVAVALSLFIR